MSNPWGIFARRFTVLQTRTPGSCQAKARAAPDCGGVQAGRALVRSRTVVESDAAPSIAASHGEIEAPPFNNSRGKTMPRNFQWTAVTLACLLVSP